MYKIQITIKPNGSELKVIYMVAPLAITIPWCVVHNLIPKWEAFNLLFSLRCHHPLLILMPTVPTFISLIILHYILQRNVKKQF